MTRRFTHLHVHTDASPDGGGTIDRLLDYAVECKFNAIGMTDHGTLANCVDFWSGCTNRKIKPLLGLEAYVDWKGTRHHLTLQSVSKAGFENIIRMSNEAHQNWTSGFPLMTFDMMSRYSHDVFAFTGCPASAFHAGTLNDGAEFLGALYDTFNKNVMVEMMMVVSDDFVTRPLTLSKKFDLPLVLTNDVHFAKPIDAIAHPILTSCRKGFTYDSDRLWLKTPEEMFRTGTELFSVEDVEDWMLNAFNFSEMAESFSIKNKPSLPNVTHLRPAFDERLRNALNADLVKNPGDDERRLARFKHEYDTIDSLNFMSYFIVLSDILDFAKSQKILIGPGRGSAAGSYILFLLGGTGVDPITNGLYFERFLNPFRKEFPDVDTDFDAQRRHEVIDYAVKKWGAFPIATYSTYSHKSLVADIGRFLKTDPALTKLAGERGEESDEFKEWASSHKEIPYAYDMMLGQMRHASTHAGGIVITDQLIPIEKNGDGYAAALTESGNHKTLAEVGAVKYDMLGLSALTQLRMMRDSGFLGTLEEEPVQRDLEKVMKIYKSGNVLGVFQFTGSDGIRDLTVKVQPDSITDLSTINALYRPGALDAGTAELYPEFKKNPRLFGVESIDKILESTYGVIVYQEQLMQIFSTVVGGGLAAGDMARRVIVKAGDRNPEWEKKIDDLKKQFYDGGIAQGIDDAILRKLWSEMFTHSRYSFNLAHSFTYADLSAKMAWWKATHPTVFYAAMMQTDIDDIQSYLFEAIKQGIRIEYPHVNRPLSKFTAGKNTISVPLSAIAFFGEDKAEKIVEEVGKNGPFKDFSDFEKRIAKRDANKRARRNLYYAGAFDGISGDVDKFLGATAADPLLPKDEQQFEAFGFFVPTADSIAYIEENSDGGRKLAGFITSWHDKNNKKGEKMRVFKVAPSGIFWMKDMDRAAKIEKGNLIRVEKTHFGMASKIFRYQS